MAALRFCFSPSVCEKESKKKQKVLVVARPRCWAGVQVPAAPYCLPALAPGPSSVSPLLPGFPRKEVLVGGDQVLSLNGLF